MVKFSSTKDETDVPRNEETTRTNPSSSSGTNTSAGGPLTETGTISTTSPPTTATATRSDDPTAPPTGAGAGAGVITGTTGPTTPGRFGRSSSDPIIPPSSIPLHRISSIVASTSYEEEPFEALRRMSPASRLRRRKLHRRGSMLCDGYAILDCLHEDDLLSEHNNNTNRHLHHRASTDSFFYTSTTSPQSTPRGKQQQRQQNLQMTPPPQTTRPPTPPPPQILTVREGSNLDPSVATFASDAAYNGETGEESKESSGGGGFSNSYPRYHPPTLFASNEAFASSMRRSVQVLQRQGTNSSWLADVARSNSQRLQSRSSSILMSPSDGKVGSSIAAVAKRNTSTPIEEQIEVEQDDQQQQQHPPPATTSKTTTLKDEEDDKDDETSKAKKSTLLLITILHLIVFSIIGEALRVFLGWLFSGAGTDCSSDDPSVLCITSSGVDSTGSGVFFEDLPANMVGSFIMGLLQKPQQDLRLVVAPVMGIAFLPAHHWFQDWGIYHLGLRTGFCGSLTTFASWNTQMVRMIDGSATSDGKSNYVAAIFGYVLGLQAAMACLSLGQAVAIWLYRATNPALAKEEDVLMYAYTKDAVGREEDELVEDKLKKLPDYEMRYLASLLPNEELRWAMQNVALLENLERWKLSTDEVRLEGDPNSKLLKDLHQIEEAILVDEAQPDEELMKIANENDWDVEALQTFAKEAHGVKLNKEELSNPPFINASPRGGVIMQALVGYLPFIMAVVFFLVMILLDYIGDGDEPIKGEYRKQWITILFAPVGAIIRWRLSRVNGTVKGSYQWFPLGTFIANMVASMISAAVEGINDSTRVLDSNVLDILYGIKTGFAGSLSTVSTFVAEGHQLQATYPHHAKAFQYMIGSLLFACGFGLVFYSPLARTGP